MKRTKFRPTTCKMRSSSTITCEVTPQASQTLIFRLLPGWELEWRRFGQHQKQHWEPQQLPGSGRRTSRPTWSEMCRRENLGGERHPEWCGWQGFKSTKKTRGTFSPWPKITSRTVMLTKIHEKPRNWTRLYTNKYTVFWLTNPKGKKWMQTKRGLSPEMSPVRF